MSPSPGDKDFFVCLDCQFLALTEIRARQHELAVGHAIDFGTRS